MKRHLFCEISPITYQISLYKEILKKHIKEYMSGIKFADTKGDKELPVLVYKHVSLIRRKLNNVDIELQNNKAINLSLSTPKVNKIIIKPGETFSFWHLVGHCTAKKGYKEGVTITNGQVEKGIAGGMCQFTNLIHWMVLHSPLDIIEYHHHNGMDLFPDFKRQIPFGTGTSICYNALDYKFKNNTDTVFQLITYTTDEYLCGELRASKELSCSFHIYETEGYFYKSEDNYYRHNKIYRRVIDKRTGNETENKLLQENNSLVMYDSKFIDEKLLKTV